MATKLQDGDSDKFLKWASLTMEHIMHLFQVLIDSHNFCSITFIWMYIGNFSFCFNDLQEGILLHIAT